MNASELLERYENMEEKHKELEKEYNEEKVVLDMAKENVENSRKELKEMGIEFSTLKQLREIETECRDKIESQIERMEEILGEDEEGDIEDLDDMDLDD